MAQVKIVIDLGYGDSGKGITTSYLVNEASEKGEYPLVIRANGGHQAGHTVVKDEKTHVFSQFGSGTLHGASTLFLSSTTLYPPSLLREAALLEEELKTSFLYVEENVKLCTPWDIDANREREKVLKHGSVGMGYGQTIQRNEDFYELPILLLRFPKILRAKVESIVFNYYKLPDTPVVRQEIEDYLTSCETLLNSSFFRFSVFSTEKLSALSPIIIETAQGLMLDQNFGIFPNVTRSNTGSKGIDAVLGQSLLHVPVDMYYVTRSYQTRHGNGFMTNEDKAKPVLDNAHTETNKTHAYQGEFRITELDIETLKYALHREALSCPFSLESTNLVITCNDQLQADVEFIKSELNTVLATAGIEFDKVLLSYSPDCKDFREHVDEKATVEFIPNK